MKFSCLQENLTDGLNISSHIAGLNKTSLPILNNILLTAKEGELKISSTNLEIAVEIKIRAKIEKEGSLTVPAQILNNYVNLLPKQVLKFEVNKNILIISTEKQKAKINGTSSEEFPIIPRIDSKKKCLLKSKKLKNALEKTIFAISSSEVRMELSGALFSFKNKANKKELTIVGTDSYRLTEITIPLEKNDMKDERDVIIPLRTLQEVSKIIKSDQDKNIELYLSENQILFIYEDMEIISRVINGKYPDYKQTVPTNIKTKALVNREEFIRVVRSASFFSKLGVNDIKIKFLPQKNHLVISSANNQIGENEAVLDADIVGDSNEIIFNYRYLIDGLNSLSNEEISLEIINDDSPGLIKSVKDKTYFYLIMPIKN
ncbi:DNA polymerase III subunit beta [Candidatus Parcubacteria bacterium 4484_255]|nr:MAG: DNA polymerase III subunit beta [Candidatus Parcubacteria bacterium 4484_255]